jgi:hypothetical protein
MAKKTETKKNGYLSVTLDVEVDRLVDEYASLRKVGRAPAIRQFLHDNLPLHIHNLRQACQGGNCSPRKSDPPHPAA